MKRPNGMEGSHYWDWVNKHSGSSENSHMPHEDAQANPDSLSDQTNMFVQKSELSNDDEEKLESYREVINEGILKKLSPKQRKVWKLRFFEGCSEQDVATKMDINIRTVKEHIERAAAKLKIAIEEQQRRKEIREGIYFKSGFKKYSKTVGNTATDAEFEERIEQHQNEIDEFCKKHPELNEDI